MERYYCSVLDKAYAGNTDPILGILRDADGRTVALADELDDEVAAGSIETVDSTFLKLDEGLDDFDNRCIDDLDGTVVKLLRAFDGHHVGYIDSETCPTAGSILWILAAGVLYTVNIKISGVILDVEVAIFSIGDCCDGSGDTVGLAFRSGVHLGAGCILSSLEALDHHEVLGVTTAGDGDFSLTLSGDSLRSRDGNGGLAGGTTGRGNRKPFRNIGRDGPGIGSVDRYGLRATGHREGNIGVGNLDAAKGSEFFILVATDHQEHRSSKGCKYISQFHDLCRIKH